MLQSVGLSSCAQSKERQNISTALDVTLIGIKDL